ncbi:hypothetical protein RND71_008343 [Anisodus tanguticus]|uniref:Uncharacterized protein n=1 Tax=Anisodus tanguticus TaxID=243964 RepID=A0AAE1SLK7_9SOLA|nr:hypothetical protein RND71_008343 [Anisodus tanguticus]
MVDEPFVPLLELEFSDPNYQEICDAFNKRGWGIQVKNATFETNHNVTPAAETTHPQTPTTNSPNFSKSSHQFFSTSTVASETSIPQTAAAETSPPQNPATNSSPPQTVPAETTAKTIEPVGSDTVEEGYDFSPESREDSDHVDGSCTKDVIYGEPWFGSDPDLAILNKKGQF